MQVERVPELGQRVVVAMSGGVDSCAAALMLVEEGYEVIGVSMQVWDYRKNGGSSGRATCCAPADFDDARDIADRAGFPFYVFDFEDSFHEAVIRPFVNSYLHGYTPNPCLDCNRKVKFHELRRRALALGTPVVATGHYAQIRVRDDGTRALYTSVDEGKDQSYFLYAMTQEDLRNTLFPVGGMNKTAVRQYLADRGFSVAKKAESQDICFVSSSVGEFVERESGEKLPSGAIVNREGKLLGRHEGITQYTVGQRKGLGVSSPHPLYVLQIDAARNELVVGAKEELARESFYIREVNWISGSAPTAPQTARVKLRYRHEGVRCELTPVEQNGMPLVQARFLDRWSAVSPGQAAVFYAEEADGAAVELYGGGIICRDDELEAAHG